jgi:hypothetical protein
MRHHTSLLNNHYLREVKKMQKIIVILILSFLSYVFPATNVYGNGPKAIFYEAIHDFGTVLQGNTITHIFKLKNSGNEELKLKNPKITGKSTTVRFQNSLQPGQDMEITLKIDTNNLIGEVETGVIFSTNDPQNPEIELKMSGLIKPIIDVRPMADVFFSVYKGKSTEKSVTIINNYKDPLQINKIESNSDRFSHQLKTIKEGHEYKLLVKVNPKASLGRTMEKVVLFTNNEKMPQLQIGVNIFVKDDVYNFPDDINFGTIDLKKLKKNPQLLDLLFQTILVKRREGKGSDFQIKLEHNIPFISIKKDPDSGSETYRLDVSLVLDKMTKGKIDTFIKVITNDKEVPEIKIPVKGEII